MHGPTVWIKHFTWGVSNDMFHDNNWVSWEHTDTTESDVKDQNRNTKTRDLENGNLMVGDSEGN